MCGGAQALAFDHFVAGFCSFLLCELSSENQPDTFLNFGKEFLFFFLLPILNFVFDGAQALFFFFFCCCVLFNLPLCKLSMISTFLMMSLNLARFVVADGGVEILGTLFYIGLKT